MNDMLQQGVMTVARFRLEMDIRDVTGGSILKVQTWNRIDFAVIVCYYIFMDARLSAYMKHPDMRISNYPHIRKTKISGY